MPGAPEFIASGNEVVATKPPTVDKALSSIIGRFRSTTECGNGISERTRADYIKQMKSREQKRGHVPLSAIGDPRTLGVVKEWRDTLPLNSVSTSRLCLDSTSQDLLGRS
jgi:hypothetical protein